MFVHKTLLEKDTFEESSISTKEFYHTESVSSEAHCILLLHQEPQCMPVPLLQADNSKRQSPVKKNPNSLYLTEFVPLIFSYEI